MTTEWDSDIHVLCTRRQLAWEEFYGAIGRGHAPRVLRECLLRYELADDRVRALQEIVGQARVFSHLMSHRMWADIPMPAEAHRGSRRHKLQEVA